MEKLSSAQVGQMLKMAGTTLQGISEDNANLRTENNGLREKVAHYEKREKAERIANLMEEKQVNGDLSFQEKVAGLMERDNLDVIEEALKLSAPQIKLASVHDDNDPSTRTEGDITGDAASASFAAGLAEE